MFRRLLNKLLRRHDPPSDQKALWSKMPTEIKQIIFTEILDGHLRLPDVQRNSKQLALDEELRKVFALETRGSCDLLYPLEKFLATVLPLVEEATKASDAATFDLSKFWGAWNHYTLQNPPKDFEADAWEMELAKCWTVQQLKYLEALELASLRYLRKMRKLEVVEGKRFRCLRRQKYLPDWKPTLVSERLFVFVLRVGYGTDPSSADCSL